MRGSWWTTAPPVPPTRDHRVCGALSRSPRPRGRVTARIARGGSPPVDWPSAAGGWVAPCRASGDPASLGPI
jgi:hypothetical protein